jgi:galactose mutarotase-like enzyme
MAVKNFVLVDADRNLSEGDWQAGPSEVGGAAKGYSVRKTTLHGGKREGVQAIEVDNGTCRFVVLPTRGMGVWKAWIGDLELGWKSPVQGPVHPTFVNLGEPSGLGWLDGFDELLCRCGMESNGAPDFDPKTGRLTYPLHGRAANLPAHRVEVSVDGDSGEITVTGLVDEVRFHFNKLRLKSKIVTRVGEPGFRVIDEVTNIGGVAGELQMLYHINFGPPILNAGAQLIAPVKVMVPRDAHAAEGNNTWDRYEAPTPGFVEQCYLFSLNADPSGQTQVLLKNAHSMAGVSLKWPVKQLPCFTVWKDTMAEADGYVTGLEPGTNFPNPRSYESEQKRVIKLAPGETYTMEVSLVGHPTSESVGAAEKQVMAIQADTKPRIFDKPQTGWIKL